MKNAPDQLADDAAYSDRFSDRGDKTELATLTRVSNTNIARQFDPLDEQHPSDYHRSRRIGYVAGYLPDRDKGEWLRAGFDEAYAAGVRDRLGADAEPDITDNELNAAWFQFLAARQAHESGRLSADHFDAARNRLVEKLGQVRTGARVMTQGEMRRESEMAG